MYGIDVEQQHLELITLFEEFLGEPRKHYESKCQISFDCPVCSDDKGVEFDGKGNLEINYGSGVYKCWACGETDGTKGRLYHLFKDHASNETLRKFIKGKYQFDSDYYDDDDDENEKPKDLIKLPEHFHYLAGKQGNPIFVSAFNYLYSRGITNKMIEDYKIGFCIAGKHQNRVIIPSYDKNGNLNYFVARAISKLAKKYKYLNPDLPKEEIIFNEGRIDWTKPVFLVEGAFDHIVVPNSIPLLGKVLYDKIFTILYFNSENFIIIVLDPDAYNDAVKIFNKLDAGRLRNKILLNKMPPEHDLSSFNENFGQEHLKNWLRTKNVKLND